LESVFMREGKTAQLGIIAPPDANIYFTRQQTMRGTGDAILLAESFAAGEPVCVAYPDDIVIGSDPLAAQLMRAARGPEDCVLGVMAVPRDEVNRYGIITPGENGRVSGIIEKPPVDSAPSCLATIGRYILPPSIYPLLRAERERVTGGEFYHVGSVNTLAEQGLVCGTEFSGKRLDVGEPVGYVKAIMEYALSRPEWAGELRTWMKEQVADFR
ncbi:MAG TPA: sugar phosphate nucleotidyltransferase, partial [Spirochaetota bacterium]|nr:sugar phosphate nucleotidyltransferase [Spirochaetota bacterium]